MSAGRQPIERASSAAVAAVILLSGTFLVASSFPLFYSDIWGHLKFGKWIVANHSLPNRDPSCPFTESQPAGIHSYWLCQLGMYLLYHLGETLAGGDALHRMAGGVDFLCAEHALALLLRFTLLLLAFRRRTGSLGLACLGFVVVLVNSLLPLGVQRPQVIGEVFFACLLLALSRPVLSRRALFLIPFCMVLWANMHGAFLIGLVLLGGCLAGRVVEAALSAGESRFRQMLYDPQLRRLAAALLASVAAISLLNPDLFAIWTNIVRMARHPNIPTMREWEPLSFSLALGWHWCYLALVALTAATFLFSRKLPSPTQFLLLAGFGVMPLLQQRMMLWWVMVGPWAISANWRIIRDQRVAHESPLPTNEETTGPAITAWTLVQAGFAVIVALCAVVLFPGTGWLLTGTPAALEKSLYPATPWQLAAQLTAGPMSLP